MICCDKTGTLTQNAMRAERFLTPAGETGELPAAGDASEVWRALGRAMALNNDAKADHDAKIQGDPTEVALLDAARHAGFARAELEQDWARSADVAFDARRRRMTTLHRGAEHGLAIVKGAPEAVLPLCRDQRGSSGPEPLDRDAVLRLAREAAESGYRLLAFAERKLDVLPETPSAEEVERDLTYLGLVALADPPRPKADEALAACASAGIRVAMTTGDHPATAKAIAVSARHGRRRRPRDHRSGPAEALRGGTRRGGRRHARLRQGLAGAEVRHRHGAAEARAVRRHDRRRGQRRAGAQTGRHRRGHGPEGHRRRPRGGGRRAARRQFRDHRRGRAGRAAASTTTSGSSSNKR